MIIFEWIIVLITTYTFLCSLSRITNGTTKSVSDYVILTLYVMNCFPIFLDLVFGVPNYPNSLYKLTIAQLNNKVRFVYDIYILFVILILGIYSNFANKNNTSTSNSIDYKNQYNLFSNKFFLFLPFLHVIFSQYLLKYLTIYGSAAQRGVSSEFEYLNAMFCLVSILAFCQRFFLREGKRSDYLILLIYSFLIVWINGKRNIVLVLFLLFVYYYNNSKWKEKHKINLKLLSFLFVILLLIYSTAYLVEARDSITYNLDDIYTMIRIDFGRDDVTKFVIDMESFKNIPIQEYRGQGLLATVFMFVPRVIWNNKPYPHYRYLTAKLVDLNPATVHFGMTPSILEQAIADFGHLGYLVCIIFLIVICGYIDKQKGIYNKALLLILILGLLSMSMDYLMIYALIYIILKIMDLLRTLTKQRIIMRR